MPKHKLTKEKRIEFINRLLQRGNKSLSSIAKEFNVSRQYASLVMKQHENK